MRLGRPRPARVRRPPRARRARPPPPPDAADLPRPPRRPARAPSPGDLPGARARPARRPGCTSSRCCPHGRSTRRPIVAAAAAAGIGLAGLAPRRVAPGPAGLIFGYGAIARARSTRAIRRLADVIAAAERRARRASDATTAGRDRAADRPRRLRHAPPRRAQRGVAGERDVPRRSAPSTGGSLEMARTAERPYRIRRSSTDDRGTVVVELYALPDPAILAAADALEAFDPADEAGSEYVRRSVAGPRRAGRGRVGLLLQRPARCDGRRDPRRRLGCPSRQRADGADGAGDGAGRRPTKTIPVLTN